MPRSAKDIQLTELKDTISKLNELIMIQTKSMESLQKTIEGLRQELGSKQAEVDYLKAKLFGSSSEKLKNPFPGQMNLFEEMPDERIPEIIEPEIIDVAAHRRERKPKATYEEMFDNLPRRQVPLDTLTDEEKTALSVEHRWFPSEARLSAQSLFFIRHIWNAWITWRLHMTPPPGELLSELKCVCCKLFQNIPNIIINTNRLPLDFCRNIGF